MLKNPPPKNGRRARRLFIERRHELIVQGLRDQFPLLDGFLNGDGDNLRALQGDHFTEVALMHQFGGLDSDTGAENAVEEGRRAAAHDMAENGMAGGYASALFDLFGNGRADADITELMVAEGIQSRIFGFLSAGDFDAFADRDNAVGLAAGLVRLKVFAPRVYIELDFGNENPVCAARDA